MKRKTRIIALAFVCVVAAGGAAAAAVVMSTYGSDNENELLDKAAGNIGKSSDDLIAAHESAVKAVTKEKIDSLVDFLEASSTIDDQESEQLRNWLNDRPDGFDRLLETLFDEADAEEPFFFDPMEEALSGLFTDAEDGQGEVIDRMAENLGVETEELREAFAQAYADTSGQEKSTSLKNMVDSLESGGVITREEAADLRVWLDSTPSFLVGEDLVELFAKSLWADPSGLGFEFDSEGDWDLDDFDGFFSKLDGYEGGFGLSSPDQFEEMLGKLGMDEWESEGNFDLGKGESRYFEKGGDGWRGFGLQGFEKEGDWDLDDLNLDDLFSKLDGYEGGFGLSSPDQFKEMLEKLGMDEWESEGNFDLGKGESRYFEKGGDGWRGFGTQGFEKEDDWDLDDLNLDDLFSKLDGYEGGFGLSSPEQFQEMLEKLGMEEWESEGNFDLGKGESRYFEKGGDGWRGFGTQGFEKEGDWDLDDLNLDDLFSKLEGYERGFGFSSPDQFEEMLDKLGMDEWESEGNFDLGKGESRYFEKDGDGWRGFGTQGFEKEGDWDLDDLNLDDLFSKLDGYEGGFGLSSPDQFKEMLKKLGMEDWDESEEAEASSCGS